MQHKGARRQEKNFPTKRAAEDFLDCLRIEKRTSDSVSVKELHRQWRMSKANNIKLTTLAIYDDAWRRFIGPAFGDYSDASEITTLAVEDFAQHLAEVRKSPRSRGMVLTILSGML